MHFQERTISRRVIKALGCFLCLCAAPWAMAAESAPASSEEDSAIEVTIVGTPLSRTAGSAHVIKEKQLKRMKYDDPHAVVQAIPGVYVRGEDGTGLRPNIGMRGVNPDRSKKLTLMEDGVLVGPAPYSAPAAYYLPVITRMVQLKAIKGPGSIAYGPQTVGGALDMITRSIPTDWHGALDVAGGEYAYRKLHTHVGHSNGKFGYLIEGIHLANNGFKSLGNGANTGSVRNEWMFKSSYLLNPTASIRNTFYTKFTYSDETSHETYLGLTDADFESNPNRRYMATQNDLMRNHRTSVVLTHVLEPGHGLTLTTDVYRHDFSRTWNKVNGFRGTSLYDVLNNPNQPLNALYYSVLTGQQNTSSSDTLLLIGPNQRTFVSQGIQSKLQWDTHTGPIRHQAEAGLRYHYDSVQRDQSESAYAVTQGVPSSDGTAPYFTTRNKDATHALALHLIDAMQYKRLTLTPGIRMESIFSSHKDHLLGTHQNRTDVVFLPGIGAFYALHNTVGLLAGVHRGFSPASPGSNSATSYESSINYEAGARFVRKNTRAEVIGFFNDYQNLTDVCTYSSGCTGNNVDQQFSAGAAHIYGVEAYAEHNLVWGKVLFPLSASYTFTQATFATTFTSDDPIFGKVQKGDTMPYIPQHQASASAGVEYKALGTAARLTYVSAMREQASSGPLENSVHTDHLMTVDINTWWKIRPWLSVYVNARNIANNQVVVSHRPFGARPNAPRWIQAGVTCEF